MKKILILCISMLIVFSITACSENQNKDMSIKASELSEDAKKVVALFDGDLSFFDIKVDETVNSYSIEVWAYRDGEWHNDGIASGGIEFLTNQIAVNLTETFCETFYIDENGHSALSFTLETDFSNSVATSIGKIDEEIPIELNKEVLIWLKIGTESGNVGVMDITEDFRSIECDAGVAVTITVSDEVVE